MLTNSGKEIFAAAVPPLSTQFISSHTLIHFRETTLHLRILSWFYQVEFGGLVGRLVGVSVLFVPFLWNSPLSARPPAGREAAIENISVGKPAPLSRK